MTRQAPELHGERHGVDAEEAERWRRFAARLDAIRLGVEAQLGAEDVEHIQRVRAVSTAMEIAGRTCLHVSLDPLTFLAGAVILGLHKQLEATEIGHSALHGAWDGIPGAERFASATFRWKFPVDEASWHKGHNLRHHGHTNVMGRDPDIDFGVTRLTPRTPHRPRHYLQVPLAAAGSLLFGPGINLHVTGLMNGPPLTREQRRAAWRAALRKLVPYYTRELVVFPALAGPFFLKVLVGNLLSEMIRDVMLSAVIFCGHVGEHVADYPGDVKARSRGEWYRMQVEAASDFEVSAPVALLCGGLERQIEHHLFPRLPPNRLREVAGEVRSACREAGVDYRSETWARTLAGVLRRLWALSFRDVVPVDDGSSRRTSAAPAPALA